MSHLPQNRPALATIQARLAVSMARATWFGAAASAVVGLGALSVSVAAYRLSSQLRSTEQQVATAALKRKSFTLVQPGDWSQFTTFYFKFNGNDRLRVLDWRRHGQPISAELLAALGDDNGNKRRSFTNRWWEIFKTVFEIAHAVEHGLVEPEVIMRMNVGTFGDGATVLADHPTAIYDRFLSDLRAIGLNDPSIERLRISVQRLTQQRGDPAGAR